MHFTSNYKKQAHKSKLSLVLNVKIKMLNVTSLKLRFVLNTL